MHWLYLGIAILFETLGTTLLKASDGMTARRPASAPSRPMRCRSGCWRWRCAWCRSGVAYAIWAGLGICLIAAIGWVAFGQKLDWPALLGMALILSGILVINLFSARV